MSRRHSLLQHRHRLQEARQIIGAMQSLAFIEVRRLRKVLDIQTRVVDGLHDAAADLLAFHPELIPEPTVAQRLYLVLGSERGFCGDFNASLLKVLMNHLEAAPAAGGHAQVIGCGRKLCGELAGLPQLIAEFEGAAVLADVDGVIKRLATGLAEKVGSGSSLHVIYHAGNSDGVQEQQLLPPFQELGGGPPTFPFSPQLNIPPPELLRALAEQYLFAVLHGLLFESLMAENHRRMQHLEGAVRHLDSRLEGLSYRENQLRQEEIIEEIEVILLNVDLKETLPGHE